MRAELWQVAVDTAHETESSAAGAVAVRTTESRALLFAAPGHVGGPRSMRRVWLVQVHGKRPFSCECSVVPGRHGETAANYQLLIVDSTTHRVLNSGYLFAEQQRLEKLGRVVRLHD